MQRTFAVVCTWAGPVSAVQYRIRLLIVLLYESGIYPRVVSQVVRPWGEPFI